MSDDKIQQKSNAGIFIGPGATGVKTQGNRIRGFDHGIEDHGKDGHHEHNEIDANKPNLLIKPEKNGGKGAAEHWYKKPIGIVGMGVAFGLIVAATLWVFKHYF